MNKTVLFILYPSYGHTYYILPTIEACIRKGFHVACLTGGYLKHLFNWDDLDLYFYESINTEVIQHPAAENNFIREILYAAAENMEHYRKSFHIVEAVRPDIIIYDSLCFFAKKITDELTIPHCTISPLMVYSKAIFEKTPQLFLQNLYRGKSIPHNDDPVFLRKKMTTLSKQITKYIKAHLSIGTYDIWDVISSYSENNFIFSSRILQRNQEVLDCRFQFVGCTTERKNCKMTPIHRLDKAPIIYISLGTTHINQKLSFYQKCIDALRNTSYFVVISLSEQIQTSELKNLSSNILLLPYVNQLSILSKAHLFITHGGANGFNEACYYGVPMLVFPQQGDQFDVADRVVELHIGTKANDEAVTCDDLKGLIHDLLSDSSVAQQISCLSSRLKEEHAKSKASDVIVQFIQDMRNI